VVRPAGASAETRPLDGAAQLAGVDNGPIEFARPTLASTVPPAGPGEDATLLTGEAPMTNGATLPAAGAAAAGAAFNACAACPAMGTFAINCSMFSMPLTDVYPKSAASTVEKLGGTNSN
jgi:hypothetical protein